MPLLADIWESRVISNGGKYHRRFERALSEYLGLAHLTIVANATLGLMLALKHLCSQGKEVITTPFSFVATANAVLWAGLVPVFADIDPKTLNLRPESIEAAITPATTAIMPVHCFGRRCDVVAIETIARKHGLRVIYDAAHAFGVTDSGGSVLRHGDLSVVSFHATKVFHTAEGGAIVSPDAATKLALDRLVNNGIVDDRNVESVGLNAKMNELSAALGLLQLSHIQSEIARRAVVEERYHELLRDVPGIQISDHGAECRPNHYSLTVLVDEQIYGESRDALAVRLQAAGIHARRYFSPLISELATFREHPSAAAANLPSAMLISSKILGLPMYGDLSLERQHEIAAVIRRAG
jgi:dTDP-4-amino-4,6-dideoxygalactose transaminase